jgi:hypothetical protein
VIDGTEQGPLLQTDPVGMVSMVRDASTGEVRAMRIDWMGLVTNRHGAVMVLDLLRQQMQQTAWLIETVLSAPADPVEPPAADDTTGA